MRVSRLIEHATVLKGLWGEGAFSFAGEHYTITALDGTPKPFRPGGPPLVICGGAPRLLGWGGSIADIVGVNPSIHSGAIDQAAADDAMAERIDEKFGWLRAGAGERFDEIELNCWVAVAEVVDDPDYGELLAPLFGTDVDTLASSPMALYGTAADIADRLVERRERWGYSYIVIPGDKARDFAPVVADLTGR